MAACYGFPDYSDMTRLRFAVWQHKMGNHKLNNAPELKVLPPTSEAFGEHVQRAHLQIAIWRSYDRQDQPDLNPLHFGWTRDADTELLSPIALPPDVSPAPVDVLKIIKCGCTSCSTARCSCAAAQLSCSVFCGCHGDICNNKHTVTAVTTYD